MSTYVKILCMLRCIHHVAACVCVHVCAYSVPVFSAYMSIYISSPNFIFFSFLTLLFIFLSSFPCFFSFYLPTSPLSPFHAVACPEA